MKHMFSRSPWFGATTQGGLVGLGFTPGPVQVPLVNGVPGQTMPMAAPPAPQPAAPRPAPVVQAPPGAVPMGKKADCPVCRSFGGGF